MKLIKISYLSIFLITSLFAQWEMKTVSPVNQLNWVHFLDTSRGFIVGNNGSVYRTSNGGASWAYSVVDPSHQVDLFCVMFTNDSLGWISGRFGSVFKTTDGGSSWKSVNTFSEIFGGYYLTQVQFINSTTGWITGSSRYIYKTSSGGAAWCVSPTGIQTIFQKIFMLNSLTGYANGSSGSAVKTTDGGDTWQQLQTGILETFNSIFFNNAANGYMIGDEGSIIKTTDGGGSWSKYANSPKQYLSVIRFANDSIGWIAGAYGSLYKTTNAGGLWSKESSNTTKSFIGLSAADKNHAWAVGEQGMVLRYGPSSITPMIEQQQNNDLRFQLLQSYPNPFNPSTTISFSIPQPGLVTIKIYDMLGKEISTIVDRSFDAGAHTVQFDAKGLSSGTYLCRLTNGANTAVQKMVLVK